MFAADNPKSPPVKGYPDFLPIIPLIDSVSAELPADPWPEGAFNPKSARPLIGKRVTRMAAFLEKSQIETKGLKKWALSTLRFDI